VISPVDEQSKYHEPDEHNFDQAQDFKQGDEITSCGGWAHRSSPQSFAAQVHYEAFYFCGLLRKALLATLTYLKISRQGYLSSFLGMILKGLCPKNRS
jgi:hypothetical protein